MFRIRKSFTFEAAHQLDAAFTKECMANIHGHSYTVELFLKSACLDECQMVLDFGILSDFISWVKDAFDHSLMLSEQRAKDYTDIPCRKIAQFPVSPTAEVMALTIHDQLAGWLEAKVPEVSNGLRVEAVRVHETATGWAEYRKE